MLRRANGVALSSAELDVALQYARGLTDKEVADALCKSYHTVRVQKRAIYEKLGISKDTELLWWLICRKTGIPFSLSEVRKYGLVIIDRYGLHRCRTALGDYEDDEL